MSDFGYAKGRIAETVGFILGEIKEFETDYAGKTWKEYSDDKKLQKLIDRTVENILTALIELCGAVITENDMQAENYADVLFKCARLFNLNDSEQKNLSLLAIQRNRLAHRYMDLRWQAIRLFSEQKNSIIKLLKIITDKQ